ncbi:transmembrane protein 220 isoform X2 [Antennarius striatus]|uniref:transmembrane protein 220 isoform X2 n=1 Tax=Antennarius striatus TaxID=241820 RepID=UPI0035B3F732
MHFDSVKQRGVACFHVTGGLSSFWSRVPAWTKTSPHADAMRDASAERRSWLLVVWRVCHGLMAVFFALAAYVQINDPDAGLWMVGYGVPAALSVSVGLDPHVTETLPWRRVADLHVMMSSASVAMLGWRLHGGGATDILQQEEGRELSGLVLTVVWFLLCRHSGRAPVGSLRVWAAVAITVFPFAAWFYYHLNQNLRSSWPPHCRTAL